MDVEQLFQDFNISYQTKGHKHCRPGWVNTECPFCSGNPGLHLGITIDGKAAYCWRCGYKPLPKAIAALLKIDESCAKEIIHSYGGKPRTHKTVQSKILKKPFKLPTGTGPLLDHHKRYLERRGFDSNYLEREWRLMSTGPVAKLSKADYRHRILIPIYWNGEMISFQARDVTNKAEVKYKACPKEREKIHHQEILYGHPSGQRKKVAACVEGVTDVWRLGPITLACFGIEYTRRQVRALAQSFERVAIIFDDDPQAVHQAEKLVSELRFRGVVAWRIPITGDPADLSNDEAEQLIKEVKVHV